MVITSSIDKYCYITVRYLPPFFDHKYRVVWSQIELPNSLEQIIHPSVRECLRFLKVEDGVEIHHFGDLPARSGIGSSSAFIVSLLNALHVMQGEIVEKLDLALEAIHIEREILKDDGGIQDPIESACGGINMIKFSKNKPEVVSLGLSETRIAEFHSWLMLAYIGFPRMAKDVSSGYDFKKREYEVRQMVELAKSGYNILKHGAVIDFGRVLHEAWELKKTLSPKIATPYIKYIDEKSKALGVIGSKLHGAGGGGFMTLFAPPDKHEYIKKNFDGLLFVPFKFENVGSQIISNGVG